LNNIHQPEPEIREDLHGRIEVFDQNIRSLEKRLRAIERRFTLEITSPQAGRILSGNFSDPFSEENEGAITVGSSVFPHGPSVSPESSIPGNSFLSKSVPSFSEENISSFALSAVVPSGETSNVSVISLDNTSDISTPGYKIRDINYLFSGLTESLRSLQTAVLELSNFVHNDLQPEIEKLDIEVKNLKNQECIINEDIKKLESHIETVENQNRFTFGSLRIPLETSGIVGSAVLFLTGFLVWSGRWDIIRSPYFSTGLAVLMAGAVFIKFYTINSEKKSLADR
jgi:chaperonin cofactor prefoldin